MLTASCTFKKTYSFVVSTNNCPINSYLYMQAALVICCLFICKFAYMWLKNGLFFWNLSSNLQWLLVFLYGNSLYSSIFLESPSLEYNEVHLYLDWLINYALSIIVTIIVSIEMQQIGLNEINNIVRPTVFLT